MLIAGLRHRRGRASQPIIDVGHGDTVLPPMTPIRLGRERAPDPAMLSLDGARLRGRSSHWLAAPSLAAALGIGALTTLHPTRVLIAFIVVAVGVWVWARPRSPPI